MTLLQLPLELSKRDGSSWAKCIQGLQINVKRYSPYTKKLVILSKDWYKRKWYEIYNFWSRVHLFRQITRFWKINWLKINYTFNLKTNFWIAGNHHVWCVWLFPEMHILSRKFFWNSRWCHVLYQLWHRK